MARSLNDRVAGRGYPSAVIVGETGEASLEAQGGPAKAVHGENVTTLAPSQVQTGFQPDTVADVPPYTVLEGAWGLPGSLADVNATPLSHAAPMPGRAGSYAPSDDLDAMHERSQVIHAQDFGSLERHNRNPGEAQPNFTIWGRTDTPGENVLQTVRGPLQAMGGYDDAQGYSLRTRYGLDAGHRSRLTESNPQPMVFIDSSERPRIVPQFMTR